jgi:UDP-2,3-diacylglucosamine pyrophosphatase LpxH
MKKKFVFIILIVNVFWSCSCQKKDEPFSFYVVTDVHMTKQSQDYTNLCFQKNVLPDIKMDTSELGEFIFVTGDMDPFFKVKESIENVLGNNFRFYPVIGNHDVGMTNNKYMVYPEANWGNAFDIVMYNKSNIKNIVNWGPTYLTLPSDSLIYLDTITDKKYYSSYDKGNVIGSEYTTYSFDEGNSHFVVLDIYSGIKYLEARQYGRITNELYDWLANDLINTKKENIFIFAHQPIQYVPVVGLVNDDYKKFCEDSARTYGIDSLVWFDKEYTQKIKSRKEFWDLLNEHKVIAYFCGHSHKNSIKKYDRVWEINMETGAWYIEGRTRYAKILVDDKNVMLEVMGFKAGNVKFEMINKVKLK